MPMACPKNKRPCFAIECCGVGQCWLEQYEQEQNEMAVKMARMCPSLGIYCYLAECNREDKCMTVERSAQKAVDTVLGPIGADKGDASATPQKAKWTCPTDHEPCEMISCNGGESCYVERQAKSGSTSGVYGSHGGTYTGYKAVPPCHEGMHQLGWIGKAELMIGRESSAKAWDQARDGKIGLIIGLLGDAYPQGNLVGMNDCAKGLGLSNLLVTTQPIPNIWIRWPDYGIVPFNRAWWENLLSIIAKVDGAVLLYCMGGHGRSGTAAAILCTLAGMVPEGADPVQWVRDKYCKKVVEADCQCDYIEKITGRKVHVHASKDNSYSTWDTYNNGGAHKKSTHGPKKKAGGGGSGKHNEMKANPNELSKRKWKAWWRKAPRTGEYSGIADITRVSQIPDGQTFVIGKRHWKWSIKDDRFSDVTPTGTDSLPKETKP